jgi:hypothetical protein
VFCADTCGSAQPIDEQLAAAIGNTVSGSIGQAKTCSSDLNAMSMSVAD